MPNIADILGSISKEELIGRMNDEFLMTFTRALLEYSDNCFDHTEICGLFKSVYEMANKEPPFDEDDLYNYIYGNE